MRPARRFAAVLLVPLSLAALPRIALAIEECESGGKFINLNNGDSTRGLTGTVVCTEDGKKRHEYKYVKGVNTWSRYFFWDTGKVEKEMALNANGNRHGLYREFWENGKLKAEETYDNGTQRGLQKTFFASGAPESMAYCLDDNKRTKIQLNEDGSLHELECSSGSMSAKDRALCGYQGKPSVVRLFVRKGIAYGEATYLEGELQEYKQIDPSTGKVYKITQHATAQKNGLRTERFANGKTKTETRYSKDGTLDGVQKEYAETGQLTREAVFTKGFMTKESIFFLNGQLKRLTEQTRRGDKVLVASKQYWDNGRLQESGTYLQEKKTDYWGWGMIWRYDDMKEQGRFLRYREDGTLESDKTYRDGDVVGVARDFWDDGKTVEREDTYKDGKVAVTKTYSRSGKLESHVEVFPDGSRKSHTK